VMTAIYQRGHHTAELFEEVVKAVGPRNATGILLSVGRCVMHALFCNTLALDAPVASIFDGGKAA
jgi:hypothetical protein